eukprot:CAMPEP_0184384570 /NCGR_PEP_ID=MMETSP0007-20130409/7973_1 /TAXON_ID=97485 /ORGANISM="Prymnesium parvum, Strain Texoma1" /LENGTH=88 /DNA_ID=CAMNT_0026731451 /DNA_START=44 /DNA_END=310 /DNA_ORIENTATION=-
MSVDFDYDENQGNSAHTECLLSIETDNNFYVATSGALPWREPDNAPGDRMVVDDEATAQREERVSNGYLYSLPSCVECLHLDTLGARQ